MNDAARTEPAVSVLIVNYNAGDELTECIDAVRRQRFDRPVEVVVVDNASADDSLARAEAECAPLTVVRNPENRGYAAAMNQALAASAGAIVLALNFDVRVDPDFLTEAVRVLESGERVGSVSGLLYRRWDADERIIDSTGISFHHMFPADRGQGKRDIGQYAQVEAVFGASGAAAVYRRAMLDDIAVGGEVFDEDFFMVVEDVDVAWRAQARGWTCLYAPKATAMHGRGTTWRGKRKTRSRYYYWGTRNRYLTIAKNLDPAIRAAHLQSYRQQEVRHFFRVWKHHGPGTAMRAAISGFLGRSTMKRKRQAAPPVDEATRRRIERFIYF